MLRMPDAPLNRSTASEAFLFQGEPRPVLKELGRQLALADLRLRLWLMDAGIEWYTWARGKTHLVAPLAEATARPAAAGVVRGEEMVKEQLHLDPEEEDRRKAEAAGLAASSSSS